MASPPAPPINRYKLLFTVPTTHLETCKNAVFKTGAGQYPGPGHYTQICFETLGIGQFRPGEGANPNIGQVGELERVQEVKCEVLCVGEDIVQKAVKALKEAHPYEEPAYEVYKMEDF
ncbi:MAG: hypothetical protein M1827_006043 [Pycnora praestabilis]|nr:MAG: hypothetical protein M1827_006043 [Pycnora praestabilis]